MISIHLISRLFMHNIYTSKSALNRGCSYSGPRSLLENACQLPVCMGLSRLEWNACKIQLCGFERLIEKSERSAQLTIAPRTISRSSYYCVEVVKPQDLLPIGTLHIYFAFEQRLPFSRISIFTNWPGSGTLQCVVQAQWTAAGSCAI